MQPCDVTRTGFGLRLVSLPSFQPNGNAVGPLQDGDNGPWDRSAIPSDETIDICSQGFLSPSHASYEQSSQNRARAGATRSD